MTDKKQERSRHPLSVIDYLLYAIAASVFATLSFSFILWLKT